MYIYIYMYIYTYIHHIYIYIYIYTHTHTYVHILSGPWKRWGSFQIVSIGRTPAQRKRNGNVDGNVTETFTETQWKR